MAALLRVLELRKAQGLTLPQLVERSGVPMTTINELERNPRNPRIRTLRALAKALNVTVDELLARDPVSA